MISEVSNSAATESPVRAPETRAVHPIERRKWWPDVRVDEVMPNGRETPDAWLCRLDDGAHALAGDEAMDLPPVRLTEGEIVGFTWCDRLGTSLLTLDEDGLATWSPAVPAVTNHFWCGYDVDTICDTAETFEEWAREYGDGEDHAVMLSAWNETEFRCRFTAIDGPPRFIPLDPIPGDPVDAVSAPADDAQGDLLAPHFLATEA